MDDLVETGQAFIDRKIELSPHFLAPELRPSPKLWLYIHRGCGGTHTCAANTSSPLQQLTDLLLKTHSFKSVLLEILQSEDEWIVWNMEKKVKQDEWTCLIWSVIASGFKKYLASNSKWLCWEEKHLDGWTKEYVAFEG